GADQDFDFIMIDCPPSLGLLTVNGLAAAGEVLVPIQCEYYALEGLGQLLRNIELVRTNLNPSLDLSTIILTMFDARTKLSDEVAEEIRKHFGSKVCRSIVPRTVRLSEAPSFGQPIILFDSSSRGALAYRAGLVTIPALVRTADDVASMTQALVENLHREDLNPMEEAAAYQQLIEDFGLTHKEVAARVGRTRASVSNTLRLFQLPPGLQRLVIDGQLSAGHARALLGTPDRSFQEQLARRAVAEGLSVR